MASGPAQPPTKSAKAFRTIGELAAETGLPQHILRYWETRFEQLRPLQRAGNRRYYRPDDVTLVHRINRLLNQEGYTVRGVQQLLKQGRTTAVDVASAAPPTTPNPVARHHPGLGRIKAMLVEALAADAR